MAPIPTRKLILQQRDRANNISRILPTFRTIERSRLSGLLVKDRLQKLHRYWTEFCKVHEDIVTRDDVNDDVYMTDSFFASTENVRDECNDELTRALKEFQNDDIPSNSSHISNGSDNSQMLCHNLHLPKIDLPYFNGRYEDWEAFENRFVSLIHEKAQLPNVVKLQYLTGCLRESAADFVKDVAITDANYASTWNALRERFSNLRLQVYHLTLSLVKNTPLKRESATGLRSLVDDITHRVRMLKNLGRPVEAWDDLLVVLVSERLDPITRKAWETYLSTRSMQSDESACALASRKKPPTFKELINFLEGTIQALLSVDSDSNHDKSMATAKTSNNFGKQRGSVKAHHTGVKSKLKTQQTSQTNTNSLKCPLCTSEHYIGRCDSFRNMKSNDRYSEVRRLGLCFNCLGRHQVRSCTSKRSCKKCNGMHHTLLHKDNAQMNVEAKESTLSPPIETIDPKSA
ncbi:uncharacterized protein [Prorops nasuta]|uniref:uncharacterized protein n=1 Tax=Prorops nasuta TaxID=863751 RepID=UPI0034CE38AE